MGFRYFVGGDTIGYMAKYEWTSPFNQLSLTDLALAEFQPFWMLLQSLCKTISEDFYVVQLFVSSFVNIAVFGVMRKYAANEFWAVFVYLLTCMLNYNCEILRASIAIGIFFLAYEQLLSKHYIRYYLLVIVAILFHDQAVLLLFVPFAMPFMKKSMSPVLILLLVITGIILSLPQVIALYAPYLPGERGEKFAQGYGSMEIASILGVVRNLIGTFLVYVLSKMNVIRDDKRLFPVFNMYFACQLLAVGMPIFSTRVSQFFQIYYLIVLSSYIYLNKMNLMKAMIVGMWLFGVVRYYTRDVTSWVDSNKDALNRYYFYERYIPYYSIWEEPDQQVATRRQAIADQEMTKE